MTCDVTGFCAGRTQFKVTCDVQNYISIVHGKPPAPPPIFRLAHSYSEAMVLQAPRAQIWGHATARSKVVASIVGGDSAAATADAEGLWRLVLPTPASAQSHTLRFSSTLDPGVKLNLTDVLFGDVWLCSGQSNMVFSMRSVASGHGDLAANASAEIAAAASHASSIRLLETGVVTESSPQSDFASPMAWSLPSAASVGGDASSVWSGFSATCWYYGREIAALTGRP